MASKLEAIVPRATEKWARVLLGLGVSVPVALAPLLGKLPLPLFPALLSLIPDSIQNVAIPVSAAAMSLVAVSVEFRALETAQKSELLRKARKGTLASAVLLGLFVVAYTLLVTRVDILGGKQSVSIITGWRQPVQPPCTGDSVERCLKVLTLEKAAITSYFGDEPIRLSSLILEGLYIGFFACFGNVVGLLVAASGRKR
jgi:hypothetical protein